MKQQAFFEFLKCISQEFFLLTYQEELFKAMKKGVYFIVVAFLVDEVLKVLIVQNLE